MHSRTFAKWLLTLVLERKVLVVSQLNLQEFNYAELFKVGTDAVPALALSSWLQKCMNLVLKFYTSLMTDPDYSYSPF